MSSLRILMVAPQPVLSPRGTPFSVMHRIRALVRLGHRVDLLTYPFGQDVELPGLRIFRCARPWGVHHMPIGPSVGKLLTDVHLARLAMRMAHRDAYDLVHTHEEAGALGAWLRRRRGIPHLYDMHSSLPQQFHNFGRYDLRPVVQLFDRIERYTLDGADGVIVICQALLDHVRELGYPRPTQLIENTLDFDPDPGLDAKLPTVRARYGLGAGPVVVYTGSLEKYQGLDLLLDAAALVSVQRPEVKILIVGGSETDSRALGEQAKARGAGANVITIPAVPPQEVQLYHRLADLLVTTRTRGTNTPLKLYQYLRTGRPMVATAIHSHTQVLDERCAELVQPDPASIAAGIVRLADDPQRREEIAHHAVALAEREYGAEAYHDRLADLLERTLRAAASAHARV